ncbi:hypothetical protein V6N13_080209 [Hibiscus sabdariffa]
MLVVWRQIVEIQGEECVKLFMAAGKFSWLLGDGTSILFWRDCWYLDVPLLQFFSQLFTLAVNNLASVQDYACETSFIHGHWGTYFRHDLCLFETKQLEELVAIVSRYYISDRGADKLIWKPSPTRVFLVGSLYKLMHLCGLQEELDLGSIWWVHVPTKIQCFLWFVMLHLLSTLCLLRDRGVMIGAELLRSKWCADGKDMIDHILMHCRFFSEVWSKYFGWWDVEFICPQHVFEFLQQSFHSCFYGIVRYWWIVCCAATLSSMWLARNELLFNEKEVSVSDLLFHVKLHSLY